MFTFVRLQFILKIELLNDQKFFMKASVQYNDQLGTAAADVSDFENNSLQSYLSRRYKSFNGERYLCIGCTIFDNGQNGNPLLDIRLLCLDQKDNKLCILMPFGKII